MKQNYAVKDLAAPPPLRHGIPAKNARREQNLRSISTVYRRLANFFQASSRTFAVFPAARRLFFWPVSSRFFNLSSCTAMERLPYLCFQGDKQRRLAMRQILCRC
jgi:hypothetical protein